MPRVFPCVVLPHVVPLLVAGGTISSTNTKDCEAEGTGTVSSVLRAGDTNVSLPCTCLGCSNFSIPHQPLELPFPVTTATAERSFSRFAQTL